MPILQKLTKGNLDISYWQDSDFQILFRLGLYPVDELPLEIHHYWDLAGSTGEKDFGLLEVIPRKSDSSILFSHFNKVLE